VVYRFAASKTVTRPDPVDLRQGWDLDDIDGTDNEGDSGNPDLQPYRTDNYDMSLEWYPEGGGAYAIGVFYKELEGFIADGEEIVPIDLSPFDPTLGIQDFEIERPINTDGGDITGFELALHTPFDVFSDGFLSHFGINASVTYVDAKLDAVRGTGRFVELRGTSEWSGNIVAYFEKGPFGARVAYNDRDDFLHQEAVSSNDFDEFTEGGEYVDVNLDYRFNENWRLRLTGNNLTDTQRFRIWGAASNDYFSDQRNDGRTYVLELRGNL
jgi:iron complex outermembrane receptor protein